MNSAGRTIRLGLVGRGIEASRSPAIHRGAGLDQGLDVDYKLLDFDTLGFADDRLGPMLARLAEKGFAGVNVTFPFKQSVLSHCRTLSPEAERIGAVNTVVFRTDGLHGHNTDVGGFGWLLDREIGPIAGQHVAQLGTGGAGAATAFALLARGVDRIVLFDPSSDRLEELRHRLLTAYPDCSIAVAPSAEAAVAAASGVVNATPVGMAKLPGTPVDPAAISPGSWVADVIYFPLETEFLRAARAQGHKAVNGVAMVIGQAAEAFALFTGKEPDRGSMLARLASEIADEATKGGA